MPRFYINSDEARITKADFNLVDVEFIDGTSWKGLEPMRLFPRSGLTRYISLVDADGHEKAIIRDIENLMPDSRKAIEDSLDEYYLIPKISAILERQEKYGILKWTVMTDRGVRSFDIRNIYRDIKLLYDGRALIRDSDDNRYEIPDIKKLDAKSMSLLALDT